MKDALKEKIFDICNSLYITGRNDGVAKINYFPSPVKHNTDKILCLFSKTIEKTKPKKVQGVEQEKDIYYRGIYQGHNEALDIYEKNLKELLKP